MPSAHSLSVIIPTRNRCEMLRDVLESLALEIDENTSTEIVVIDNGSTDATRDVVTAFTESAACPVIYHYEAQPGLHVGRNLGIQLARGNVLAYLDDDVLVTSGWLSAIMRSFTAQPDLAILGGPCPPKWEAAPPSWIKSFRVPCGENGWMIPPLSLVMYSDKRCVIPGQLVFGCNYCIRKDVALSAGGFHPDGMPTHLLRYRGDGETGMTEWAESRGLGVWYDPQVRVEHRVSRNRLTLRYFSKIYQRNGVGAAYTLARSCQCATGTMFKNIATCLWSACINIVQMLKAAIGQKNILPIALSCYANITCVAQLCKILFSKNLQCWVRQESYFIEDPCPYWDKQ